MGQEAGTAKKVDINRVIREMLQYIPEIFDKHPLLPHKRQGSGLINILFLHNLCSDFIS